MPPTPRKPDDKPTAPGDDARHPDTVADKRTDSPARPTDIGVDETNEELNAKYGFSTIDTSGVSHEAAEPGKPVQVDQESGSSGAQILDNGAHRNSTFADRAKSRDKRQNTRVDPGSATSK
jgi:hypothetical protein